MVDIGCSYPVDAKSNERDDNGCGPLKKDYKFGSASNAKLSKSQKYRKSINFNKTVIQNWSLEKWWEGPTKSWKDFACDGILNHYKSITAQDNSDETALVDEINVTSLYPKDDSSLYSCKDNIVLDPYGLLNNTNAISSAVQRMKWEYQGLMDHPPCVDKSDP